MLARVVGADAAVITQTDIVSGVYSVYLLDDQDADSRTDVTGHSAVALVVNDVIFNTLQTDDLWTVDDEGYNFRQVLDVSANEAFVVAGRRYLAEITLTPSSGQVIVIRFRFNVI
jgi:hypothetical protein